MNKIPRMLRVRQNYPPTPAVDIEKTLERELEKIRSSLKPGMRIAIAVGSRGITNMARIIRKLVALLREAGAEPAIIPAMGSHGGATPEGQADVLASYGISEKEVGAPVHASLEVRQVGSTEEGIPVFCSVEGLERDGIIIVNRVKPHTDFTGTLGSGILKMAVIGVGKRAGACAMHNAATRLGYEHSIRTMSRVLFAKAPVLCGIAIVENQNHETARVELLPRDEIEARENELFLESQRLMPKLPFEEMDLLIVDRIGKEISGAGMDPNVTGRWVHGYLTSLAREDRPAPFVRRVFVRDLTPESYGNAIGIGLADFTTTRLVKAMVPQKTFVNALTSLTLNSAKIPIHFDNDREAIERALDTLALDHPGEARVVRIKDTLFLSEVEVSESCLDQIEGRQDLTQLGEPSPMQFDEQGNLGEF